MDSKSIALSKALDHLYSARQLLNEAKALQTVQQNIWYCMDDVEDYIEKLEEDNDVQ